MYQTGGLSVFFSSVKCTRPEEFSIWRANPKRMRCLAASSSWLAYLPETLAAKHETNPQITDPQNAMEVLCTKFHGLHRSGQLHAVPTCQRCSSRENGVYPALGHPVNGVSSVS